MGFTEKSHLYYFVENFLLINNHQTNLSYNNYRLRYLQEEIFFIKKSNKCPIKGKKGQSCFNNDYICNVHIPTIHMVCSVSLALFVKPILGFGQVWLFMHRWAQERTSTNYLIINLTSLRRLSRLWRCCCLEMMSPKTQHFWSYQILYLCSGTCKP